jgi:hypothetical protein
MKTFVEADTIYAPPNCYVGEYYTLTVKDGKRGVRIPDGWEYVRFEIPRVGVDTWLGIDGVVYFPESLASPGKARIILRRVNRKIDLREIRYITTEYIPEKIEKVVFAKEVYQTDWLELEKPVRVLGFRPPVRGDKFVTRGDKQIDVCFFEGMLTPRLIVEEV